MDTASLLKQEINKTLDDLHDFAKWKLIAVSSLATAGLGLAQANSPNQTYWLLVFVPYACAYVDLNCYQYLLRILLIAKVLRRSQDERLLQDYEDECENYRHKGLFGFGIFAQLGSSLAFSTILPAFALPRFVLAHAEAWLPLALAGWILGLLSLVLAYLSFANKCKLLDH